MTTVPAFRPTEPDRLESTRPSRPGHGRRLRGPTLPVALVLPAIAALTLALGYPLVRQLVLSVEEFGLPQQFGRPAPFVGLDNYADLITDPYLWRVTLRSVVFCLVNAAVTMLIGLGVALLMVRMSKPVRLAVQSGLLIAWAMPVIAALTVWEWLFDTEYGVVNWVLTHLGFEYAGHSWLLDPMSFFFVASVIVVWMSVPFVAFTGYAALMQVPGELMEAAEIDGAGAWDRFKVAVWPSIKPVVLVILLLQVIWDLRVFTQIYVLQKAGGQTRDTNLLGTYIYRLGIGGADFGMAAAVAMFMLALTIVMTAPYVRMMLKQEADQ